MRDVLVAQLALVASVFLSACAPPPGSPHSSSGSVGPFNPNSPNVAATPYATPDAEEMKRGEDLENREAREAEEKAAHANDPANQVKAEQQKIEDQIQQEQEKAEGLSN